MNKAKVSYNGEVKYYIAICEEHAVMQYISSKKYPVDRKLCHAEFVGERGVFPYLFNQDADGLKAFIQRTGFDMEWYRAYQCTSGIDRIFLNETFGRIDGQ